MRMSSLMMMMKGKRMRSDRDEDSLSGLCWACLYTVLLACVAAPKRATLHPGPGGLGPCEIPGRFGLGAPENRTVSRPLNEDWSSKTKPSIRSSHIQLEREQLLKNGLHSGLANRKLSATMEPDLDGRTVLARQSRCQALSDTYRD